jgi:hypothetical protein
MPLQKTADFEDCSHNTWGAHGGLLQGAAQMKLVMLFPMHFIVEAWRLITPSGFSIDHVSIDDSAVKRSEDEEDDWHRLQPLGVQLVTTRPVTVLSRSVSEMSTRC